jgi:hypothetical protein
MHVSNRLNASTDRVLEKACGSGDDAWQKKEAKVMVEEKLG